jgi:hypothetical protein
MQTTASAEPCPSRSAQEGQTILEDARKGHFDQLLIYKLDRLGRDTRMILNTVDALEQIGVRVRSMTEEFDTGTASGRLMLTLLSGFAAHEREMIRERSIAGTKRLARAGAWLGGIVPFGYRKEGDKRDAKLVIADAPSQSWAFPKQISCARSTEWLPMTAYRAAPSRNTSPPQMFLASTRARTGDCFAAGGDSARQASGERAASGISS